MKTDIFHWHGYADLLLNEKWVKATPAFNKSLTDKFRMKSLEFDGVNDSIYHPFDLEGNKHMEYLQDRGTYADLPIAEMIQSFRELYPYMKEESVVGDFDADVEKEVIGL